MKKSIIVTIVLGVLLIGALSYIGYDVYKSSRDAKDLEILQSGTNYGYEQAIAAVMNQATNCNVVPLTYNNVTVNLVDVECLKAQGGQ